MSDIVKFSQSYDSWQDRMAWDAEAADGSVTRLWMTQRLSRGLVAALVPMLQTTVTPEGPAASAQAAHEAVVQSWAQAAALDGFGSNTPVKPDPKAPSGLVKAVHLNPGPTGIALVFEFHDGGRRRMPLVTAAVRQTLSVMYRLCQEAGWPTEAFPDWVADPVTGAAPASESVN